MARIQPFEAPIPGQSMTLPPKTYPFDRPPKHTNPAKAADELFNNMMRPKSAKSFLLLMEVGMPISFLGEFIVRRAFTEGMISIDMMPLLAGPVGVMLGAMANGAGIDPKLEFEKDDSIATMVARLKTATVGDESIEEAIESAEKSQDAAEKLVNKGGGLGAKR